MKTLKSVFLTVIIFAALISVSLGVASAETLCVNPGGTDGCYATIQAAIDAIGATDSSMQNGAGRLTALQNDDGGWDWPLDNGNPATGSAANTIGPIGMGFAQAYSHTVDPDHLAALEDVGAFLLTKVNNFSPSDGYLAAKLDQVLGGTTYTAYVNTYFYDQLAAGTYDRNGLGTLYTTAAYVQLIRDARAGQGIANLAAWDIGMGLVGAASAGASTAEWVAGVEAEIDELDGDEYYDVIGLAGAVYGLAFVGEDFDPTAGEHASAGSLSDLAAILASYQIAGGGFAWNSNYVIPGDGNETIQETAYATMALNEVDRSGYWAEIRGAADYMRSVQLGTGGWENYVGDPEGENNEITAEALWGHTVVYDASASVINVAAGTYGEPLSIADFTGLTINGEDKTTVIVQPTSVLPFLPTSPPPCYHPSKRAAIRVLDSTDVVLQNITFDMDIVKANYVHGIFYCDSTGTVQNNIVKNLSLPDATGGYVEIGSDFRGPSYTDSARAQITISGNTFVDTGRIGVVTHEYVDAKITGNTFYKSVGSEDFGYAIEIGGASTATIEGNTIYGYDTPALSDDSESAGIYIENAFTGTCGSCTFTTGVVKNVVVENNEIYNGQYGMWIGNGYDTYAGDVDINVTLNENNLHDNWEGGVMIQDEDSENGSSVTVTGGGNSLTDNGEYGYRLFTQGDGDVTVGLSGETITGHVAGVFVDDTSPAVSLSCSRIVGNVTGIKTSSPTVTATDNVISGNTSLGFDGSGIAAGTVSAEDNWWGAMDGPSDGGGSGATGSGDSVTANVDFTPFASAIPDCVITQETGLSVRKMMVRAREPGKGLYRIKGDLDTTSAPAFLAEIDDIEEGGMVVAVDSTSGEVNSIVFSGADCSVDRGNVKCRDSETRSVARLAKRSSQSFFRVRISVKGQTFTMPTVVETPLTVRIQTLSDLIERRDDIGGCQARGSGLICKELP